MQKNYYEIIGLQPSATQSEIDDACIALAKKCDPLQNAGDLNLKIQFTEIEEAYEILGNPEKRKLYDEKLNELPISASSHDAGESKILNPFLVLGIIFMPFIFCWFLLRKGYSRNVKVLGFGYLALLLSCALLPELIPNEITAPTTTVNKTVSNEVTASTSTVNKTISNEPTTSDVLDSCFSAGKFIAVVYFANFDAAMEVGLQPTSVMSKGCTVRMDELSKHSMDCYNACEDGFKYATKSFLNK